MAGGDGERRRRHSSGGMVPLALLIGEEARMEKMERPRIRYGCAAQSKKGEDYFLIRTDCCRVPGDPSSSFSVFAPSVVQTKVFRTTLYRPVRGAVPTYHTVPAKSRYAGVDRYGEPCIFHELLSGQTSGTTVTFVIIDGWTITVASVGDSRCILDAQGGGVISALTVDHRLEENVEEWVSLLKAGGRLIIASDGIWDALTSDMAANSCRGLPAELAARQVVKPKDSVTKLSKKLSAVGIVEELFEEGSAMLAERLGNDSSAEKTSNVFTCAICQAMLAPSEGVSVHAGSIFSTSSKPWEGPFLCADCRNKKDAMEGKRPSGVKVL
ncbi:hypothetical protein GW17_00021037 [Ensete ventricosum]|nr:hypothetical protein GW17_00021037 [Ensete ventricosum]